MLSSLLVSALLSSPVSSTGTPTISVSASPTISLAPGTTDYLIRYAQFTEDLNLEPVQGFPYNFTVWVTGTNPGAQLVGCGISNYLLASPVTMRNLPCGDPAVNVTLVRQPPYEYFEQGFVLTVDVP